MKLGSAPGCPAGESSSSFFFLGCCRNMNARPFATVAFQYKQVLSVMLLDKSKLQITLFAFFFTRRQTVVICSHLSGNAECHMPLGCGRGNVHCNVCDHGKREKESLMLLSDQVTSMHCNTLTLCCNHVDTSCIC